MSPGLVPSPSNPSCHPPPLTPSLPSPLPSHPPSHHPLHSHPPLSVALEILTQPQHQTIFEGHTLYLVVVAEGPPPLTFQWFKEGVALPYGTSNELVIQPLQLQNQGAYTCSVTAGNGASMLSNEAIVTGKQQQIGLAYLIPRPLYL